MQIKTLLVKSKEGRNAAWIIGGKLAQMAISLFVSILTARYLGPNNYGLINYASSFMVFFSSFCTLGINSVIIKNFIDFPDEQGATLGSAIRLRLLSSVISVMCIVLLVSITDRGHWEAISVTFLCSIALIFQPFDTIIYWFQNRYQSKVTAKVSLCAYILTTIYKLFLLVTNKSVQWFAVALTLDYILVALFLVIVYRKHGGQKMTFKVQKCKQLLEKSRHYILPGMMIAIYGQVDKFMLRHMLNEESVGYYSLATTINNMWVFVLSAIIDSMYPTILRLYSQNDYEGFKKKNRQLYAIVIYVSLAVAIVFILFGKLAIQIVYGKAYLPAYEPLKYVVWYTVFAYLGVARNAWVVCENKQKYLKYLYVIAAVANVFLNLIFIPAMGTTGAALASCITQFVTIIVVPGIMKPFRENAKLMIEALFLRNVK